MPVTEQLRFVLHFFEELPFMDGISADLQGILKVCALKVRHGKCAELVVMGGGH